MPDADQSVLAIIPARGGSKRLPRKNIVDFCGKPIIAYTIEAALECGRFRRVVVSTEDNEIADIARRFGADVDDRPAHLAGDGVGAVEVCLDLLNREEAAGHADRVFCCLYPTAPMRGAADIAAVVDLVEPGRFDFAMAVTAFDLPPHQALKMEPGGQANPLFPDLVKKRDEEIGRVVVDNGSTYAATIAAFREHRTFYGPALRCHEMPRARSVDINVAEDLEFASFLYRRQVA